ncbi:MAG TPA: hypothetical protein VMF69_17205 [Gemmataceae bacterium]|nr:hypothetical protein [Gemmataceae bacterium]
MKNSHDVLESVCSAFSRTIALKVRQLYEVVPKGENPALTGDFVEELVRGFIREWISPCLLLRGTLFPQDANLRLSSDNHNPKQIDGIIYDPRLGPAIIREGSFLVAHSAFCRGIIEIKTSVDNLKEFEDRLQALYAQYLAPGLPYGPSPFRDRNHVMGIVIHDADPKKHSKPDWLSPSTPIYHYSAVGHCPIFILFKRVGDRYEPYEPGIKMMIEAIYRSRWQHATLEDKFGSEMPEP